MLNDEIKKIQIKKDKKKTLSQLGELAKSAIQVMKPR
jgi:hypothetical protein